MRLRIKNFNILEVHWEAWEERGSGAFDRGGGGVEGVDTPMHTTPPMRSGPEKAHLNRVNCSRLGGVGVKL